MENNSVKRKKNNTFIKAISITVGVIVVLVAVLLLWGTEIINFFFHQNYNEVDHTGKFAADSGDDTPTYSVPLDGQEAYNFLIVGHDRAADLADVSMLVNFNVKDCTVRLMQLPRDTYVNYDGYWYHKINGVYNYYKDSNAENPELEGIKGYAEFLEKNLCVKIHYYAVMDLDQFVNIVDALGGVDMYVENDMEYVDPNANPPLKINIKAGQQTLDGAMSEQFIRYRYGYVQGDIGRGQAQKQFMAALFNTVKNKVSLLNIGKVCGIINDNLITNMTTQNIIYFANIAKTVKLENIIMLTLPGNFSAGSDGLSYYAINKEGTLEAVNSYFNIYADAITPEIFDKDAVFNNGGKIYNASKDDTLGYVYDADTLVNGSETIPK